MEIINVVVTRNDNDNFGITSFPILREEDRGVQAKRAEDHFIEEVKAISKESLSEDDLKSILDDGIYADERTGTTVYLSWSIVKSVDHADSTGRIS